jgi:peptide/nickel transport system substrate-binding protein
MLTDKTLDAQIDAAAALPSDQATAKWSALDPQIMGQYIAIPFYYDKMAVLQGTNVGTTVGDATMGMPFFQDMYLKS